MRAIIFAGGKSSRMKQDKALLPFKGVSSLTKYQYNRLNKIFKTVYISAKNNKFDFDCEIIKDNHKESSPLIALISIFQRKEIDKAFILSVDSPFIDKEIIEELIKNDNDKYDAIVAKSPNGLEPLCAIYKKSILHTAQKHLSQNNHKLNSLLKELNIKVVEFQDIDKFMNLNYPRDYIKANC